MIGYVLNGVTYCEAHKPTSRLAEIQMSEIKNPLPSDRCHVCGRRFEAK